MVYPGARHADHAAQLAESCRRHEIRQGDIIAAQGYMADCMHFILEGRIGVMIEVEHGPSFRVRSLGRTPPPIAQRTTQAEANSVLYALSIRAYERLKRENRPLHQALVTYVVTVMAERLSFASKVIGVLRR
jgi:sulfate permease, SulP family